MEQTIPKLLQDNFEKWPNRVWMRKKELGIWQQYTWKDAYQRVKLFSLGLLDIGLEPGDMMAVLGDNDPHWFWAELGALCAGGRVTGLFTSCSPPEVKYLVELSDSRFVVAQDQEQVDKLLAIKDTLPLLKKVIYWDPKGMRHYDDPVLISFDAVAKLGLEYEKAHPGLFEANVAKVREDDIALMMCTSGTTGEWPKLAMYTYHAMFSTSDIFYALNPIRPSDDYLSLMLPGTMAEQGWALIASLKRGSKVNFPESLQTIPNDTREVGPHQLLYVSALWDGVVSTIQHRIAESNWIKRVLWEICLPIGYRAADAKFRGEKLNPFWTALYKLARFIVFNPLRDKLGLLRIRFAFTSGSALGPETFRLITAIGVDLRQIYGSSEMGIAQHSADDIKVDSVGRVNPDTIVRIMDDNHILARGESCAVGYYKNPAATAKALADGWYHTGDAGYLDDDGHLYYLDRLEYMSRLADGTMFAPQYIESRLKFSPYIKHAFVVGDETRDFVGLVVNIDLDNVGNWAERRKIPYTTFADLSQKPEVCHLIAEEVKKTNNKLPKQQRVRRFVNMPKEFDPDEAELTRTMKLRRKFLADRYKEIIATIYGETERAELEVPVVYRDGRHGAVKAEICVNRLE